MTRFPSDYEDCEQLLAPDGSFDADAVAALDLDEATLRSMYESMLQARALEDRGLTLQRRGDFHFWMEARGLEAAHVAPVAALADTDWLQTDWRQYGAHIERGRPLEDIALFWLRGYEEWPDADYAALAPFERRLPHIVAVGTQIPQAVGMLWGRKYQGHDEEVGLVMLGDGASSKGDFHAGLTFAGVLEIPVVFFLLNNQWAISVPVERQTAAETFAAKAPGYGFEGVLVDGNDPLAVYRATKRAVERARTANEPTLIEALTYRRGAHSSSDDPGRYRSDEEVAAWEARDPVDRFESFLEAVDLWTPEYGRDVRDEAKRKAQEATDRALTIAESQSIDDVFESVFVNPPPQLAVQHEELRSLHDTFGDDIFHEQ